MSALFKRTKEAPTRLKVQNCSFESFLDPTGKVFPYKGKRFKAEKGVSAAGNVTEIHRSTGAAGSAGSGRFWPVGGVLRSPFW